jgi:hypothetical protein
MRYGKAAYLRQRGTVLAGRAYHRMSRACNSSFRRRTANGRFRIAGRCPRDCSRGLGPVEVIPGQVSRSERNSSFPSQGMYGDAVPLDMVRPCLLALGRLYAPDLRLGPYHRHGPDRPRGLRRPYVPHHQAGPDLRVGQARPVVLPVPGRPAGLRGPLVRRLVLEWRSSHQSAAIARTHQ